MCDPTIIALTTFALSTASAVAQHQQQNAIHKINQQNALEDFQRQTYDAGIRQQQENEAAGIEMQDRQRQGLEQASAAQAQIGETGVGGFSMAALMGQVMNDASRDAVRSGLNREWSVAQIGREQEGIRANTINRMNSTSPASALATGLQIANAGISSATYYNKYGKTPKG